jgi:hypothetical protein
MLLAPSSGPRYRCTRPTGHYHALILPGPLGWGTAVWAEWPAKWADCSVVGSAVQYVARHYPAMALWRSQWVSQPGRVKRPLRAVTCGLHRVATVRCYEVEQPREQKYPRLWPVEKWKNTSAVYAELRIEVGHGVLRLSHGTHDNGNFQRLFDGVY